MKFAIRATYITLLQLCFVFVVMRDMSSAHVVCISPARLWCSSACGVSLCVVGHITDRVPIHFRCPE